MKSLRFALYELTMLVATNLALLVVFFDPNLQGRTATHLLSQNRTPLRCPGGLQHAVFPRLGVDLGAVGLSERGSSRFFAAAGRVRLFITWLPALRGEWMVDERVDGAVAHLERRAGGSTNFSDLKRRIHLASSPPRFAPEGGHSTGSLALDDAVSGRASGRQNCR